MSRLAAADRIQSTEECLTQEGRPASETTGLNTCMNAAEGMQLLSRELISDAVWRRANKYTFYESDKTPLDIAVQTCNVKFLDIFFDCVDLDEQVKTRMVSNAYTNFFLHGFSQISKDQVAMVKRLLELGADVNGRPSVFPLSVAIKAGSYPLVELLCQHGADVNKIHGQFGLPPIYIAMNKGSHYDKTEVMLKYKAYRHDKVLLYSPVYLALVNGHMDCAKLLLHHGANFNIKDALRRCIYNLSVAYMNFLLAYSRHETQQFICKHQRYVLKSAVLEDSIELISHILDITGEYPCLEELLAESGNGEVASFLIQKGADVNKLVESCGGYTPLYVLLVRDDMCQASRLQVVKVLLENGASPNICGDTSPLMLAALTNNSTDLLQLLLDYGADVNWRDNKGDTVFSYSAYQGCDSNAEFLLKCAKDKHFITSKNNKGLTVLMQAAGYSNVAVVKEVINHNPDINMTDNKGNTALLYAINRTTNYATYDYDDGADDIVTILINAGCDVNLQNDDGLSPLMLAASRYRKKAVQILLDAGADINAVSKTDRTKTAMSYFQSVDSYHQKDFIACLAMFLAHGAYLSYLQPKMIHRMLFCNDSDTIRKFITNGTGLVTVRSDEYYNFSIPFYPFNFSPFNFSPADLTFDISPLCTALLSGNASLARHFVDIMWLTKSDLTSLTHNKPVRSYLEKEKQTQCLNLLGEMSSQPVSLFKLAFVEVSTAVGTAPGRENRVNKLPLPQLLKAKLLFKSAVDSITPAMDTVSFHFVDVSPKLYIDALDCCKCCRVWKNLKLNHHLRTSNFCFTCAEHSCSKCFLSHYFTQSRILW